MFSCFLSGPPAPNSNDLKSINNSSVNAVKIGNTSTTTTTSSSIVNETKSSLAQEEQDFFNQIPTEKEKAKMTKDSIMALYAAAPAINQFNANFNAAPTSTVANNHQFVGQMMPPQLNSMPANAFGNGSIQFSTGHPTQYGMQPQNFQMPLQQQQQQHQQHQQQPHTIGAFTSFPQQSTGGFPMQPFAQHPNSSTSLPPATSNNFNGTNNPNLNQQFGNLSLGNVWQ